jgi:hypothetical protein
MILSVQGHEKMTFYEGIVVGKETWWVGGSEWCQLRHLSSISYQHNYHIILEHASKPTYLGEDNWGKFRILPYTSSVSCLWWKTVDSFIP